MRQEQQKQQYTQYGGTPYNRFMPPGPGGMPPAGVHPNSLPPGALPSYSGPVQVPSMYSQQGHPPYMGHQMPFPGHLPAGEFRDENMHIWSVNSYPVLHKFLTTFNCVTP